ncbi:alpha/beta hydrolase [Pelagibacterium sediminicola]|uniref:alpha/beta hydrolase n=1 Tax=Pelagibacterium sediminicola TaxID=2248761 RepID=UPI000E31D8D9|nr:alpha/beta hydrolase [Pelagibacterium sediminicola]
MSTQNYIHKRHEQPDAGALTFFVFHGTGGDENQFFELARQLRPDARVIAPRGDVSEGGALRYFRRTGEGRYDMDDLAQRTKAMADFVAEAKGEGKVLGLGYSNGANILASVMLEAPGLFDAAVLMHPLIPWAPAPVAGLAGRDILITAGEHDPICPAPQTRALADYFAAQDARTQTFWHGGGHEVRNEELQAIARFVGDVE